MITFRQKEYTSRGLKVAVGAKKFLRNTKSSLEKGLITPTGELVDSEIRVAAGNPIRTTATILPVPGSGIASTALEAGLKSKSPGYKRLTQKLQEGYSKSGFSKGLRKARTPSLFEMSHYIPVM